MKHLSNEERITLFSDNRKEAAADIVNTLESGKDVLCDRYVPSALAYEMAHGGDYTNLIAHEIGLPKPDLVLLVDTPPEVAATRSQYGGEVYEKVDFQTKVASAYKELVRKGTEHWHVRLSFFFLRSQSVGGDFSWSTIETPELTLLFFFLIFEISSIGNKRSSMALKREMT
jgi:hypothetical protein